MLKEQGRNPTATATAIGIGVGIDIGIVQSDPWCRPQWPSMMKKIDSDSDPDPDTEGNSGNVRAKRVPYLPTSLVTLLT